jgi:hypothetical protein
VTAKDKIHKHRSDFATKSYDRKTRPKLSFSLLLNGRTKDQHVLKHVENTAPFTELWLSIVTANSSYRNGAINLLQVKENNKAYSLNKTTFLSADEGNSRYLSTLQADLLTPLMVIGHTVSLGRVCLCSISFGNLIIPRTLCVCVFGHITAGIIFKLAIPEATVHH